MKRVVVTGGAGNIAYSLLFRIAAGDLLGPEEEIALHILDLPGMETALLGLKMELEDCAFPLLKEVQVGSDPEKLFEGVDYALLIGAKPRGPGMERKDLLTENSKIFVEQGKALDKVASRGVKVLVVGNPCNTNCLIAMQNAPSLPRKNFFAMMRLDQNRAMHALARKANAEVTEVSHVAIWGNHSSTQVPDFEHAEIHGRPAKEAIKDLKWLEEEFVRHVQQRGADIIKARGKSSAASAANAVIDTVQSINCAKKGEWFSVALSTEGNPYGIKEDLIFGFPCELNERGEVEIVKGLNLSSFLKEKIAITEKELIEEREVIWQMC